MRDSVRPTSNPIAGCAATPSPNERNDRSRARTLLYIPWPRILVFFPFSETTTKTPDEPTTFPPQKPPCFRATRKGTQTTIYDVCNT
mmetsp:Transcript_21641/g.45696  ORF Transcript_21641/g.45696 Transcript_21641/m.45696 type:complete len:87 (-) Transcript_21641:794-1054(-)